MGASPTTSRSQLMAALQSTYPDSKFVVCEAVDADADYTKARTLGRSNFKGRDELLHLVEESEFESFPNLPDGRNALVINPRLFIYKSGINDNQVFPDTPDVDDFFHCVSGGSPHRDVFFKFDHERKLITFALGHLRRTLALVEHSGWAWSVKRDHILCNTSEDLERSFKDGFWSWTAVQIGRKCLGIKPVLK